MCNILFLISKENPTTFQTVSAQCNYMMRFFQLFCSSFFCCDCLIFDRDELYEIQDFKHRIIQRRKTKAAENRDMFEMESMDTSDEDVGTTLLYHCNTTMIPISPCSKPNNYIKLVQNDDNPAPTEQQNDVEEDDDTDLSSSTSSFNMEISWDGFEIV